MVWAKCTHWYTIYVELWGIPIKSIYVCYVYWRSKVESFKTFEESENLSNILKFCPSINHKDSNVSNQDLSFEEDLFGIKSKLIAQKLLKSKCLVYLALSGH